MVMAGLERRTGHADEQSDAAEPGQTKTRHFKPGGYEEYLTR